MVKYEKGITLITPTGDRPECIQQCIKYINRQILRPNQWVIVDDGITKSAIDTFVLDFIQHIKLPYLQDKVASFTNNIRTALQYVKYDKIIIIEDDDWYPSNYLEIMSQRLEGNDLVGEGKARYYNIEHKCYRICNNTKHASFCQTGLQSKIINNLFVSTQKKSAFIDSRLWNKSCKKFVFQDIKLVVGIKGMPGRKGIGIGHRPKKISFKSDKDWKKLIEWIGEEDTAFYRRFAR